VARARNSDARQFAVHAAKGPDTQMLAALHFRRFPPTASGIEACLAHGAPRGPRVQNHHPSTDSTTAAVALSGATTTTSDPGWEAGAAGWVPTSERGGLTGDPWAPPRSANHSHLRLVHFGGYFRTKHSRKAEAAMTTEVAEAGGDGWYQGVPKRSFDLTQNPASAAALAAASAPMVNGADVGDVGAVVSPLLDAATGAWRTFHLEDCGTGQDIAHGGLVKVIGPWPGGAHAGDRVAAERYPFPPLRWLGDLAVVDTLRDVKHEQPSGTATADVGGASWPWEGPFADRLLPVLFQRSHDVGSAASAHATAEARVNGCRRRVHVGVPACGPGLPWPPLFRAGDSKRK